MIASPGWIVGLNGSPGSRQQPALRTLWLAAAAAVLVACGGGGSGGSATGFPPLPSDPPPAPPVGKGSVVIRAITTAGMPVSDVSVALNGGFDGPSLKTDANGEALFEDVPAGYASTNLGGSGYYGVYRQFNVTAESQTRLTFTLQRMSEAVPILLATHPAEASADGRRLTFEVDLAILTEDGSSRANLVAADFGLEGGCGWYQCVVGADGRDTGLAYQALATAAPFNPVSLPADASSAVGVLIEQSATMGRFDPQGLRLQAVQDYFDRVLPPNLVALASQRDIGSPPVLTTYGGFTSDGSQFRSAIDGLRGQEAGVSRMLEAVAGMTDFMTSGLQGVTVSPRRAMVVMGTWESGCPELSTAAACTSALQSAIAAARAAGVTVLSAGTFYSPASEEFAAGTGGASVAIQDPSQWPVLFRALDPLVGGGLSYYRVRLELDGGGPGVFVKGRRAWGVLTIRTGTDTELQLWPLQILI